MHGREWMKARGWTRILYGEAPELSIPAFGGLKSALSGRLLTATFHRPAAHSSSPYSSHFSLQLCSFKLLFISLHAHSTFPPAAINFS